MQYDEAKILFKRGQEALRTAAQTQDPILAMRGRALCHRAIELRWYTHPEGNLLDPPWVKRTIVKIGGIEYQAPGPNLGHGDPDYLEWISTPPTDAQTAPLPPDTQLTLF